MVTAPAVQYNPFKFGRNRQFRNFYAAPGVRYWLLESYMGGFIGMYGTAGTYSVGNLFGNKYRLRGEGYGVGLRYREGLPDRQALEPRMGSRCGCRMAGL